MKVGDIVTLTAGKFSCKYLIVSGDPAGLVLRRVQRAITKADNNRFQETILIAIGPNAMLRNSNL